jgi:hypothetical protein
MLLVLIFDTSYLNLSVFYTINQQFYNRIKRTFAKNLLDNNTINNVLIKYELSIIQSFIK